MNTCGPRLGYGGRCHAAHVADAPALAVQGLTLRYAAAQRPALDDVSLELGAGRCVALIGGNGAGKSTLLKAIAGLLRADAGSVRVGGVAPGDCRQRIAYLPQRSEIDWRFPVSVERLVLAGRFVHLGWFRGPGRAERDRAREELARLGIGDLAERQIGTLSGGQQQRALLARALVQDAQLVLLDEPLNAVDAETRHTIADELERLRDQGRSILVATHDLGPRGGFYDDVVCLHEGRRVEAAPGRLPEDGHHHHEHGGDGASCGT